LAASLHLVEVETSRVQVLAGVGKRFPAIQTRQAFQREAEADLEDKPVQNPIMVIAGPPMSRTEVLMQAAAQANLEVILVPEDMMEEAPEVILAHRHRPIQVQAPIVVRREGIQAGPGNRHQRRARGRKGNKGL
jgi:hypothetical protein